MYYFFNQIMGEIWKDVKDYEGVYQVSSFGRIKSLSNKQTRKEKILKTFDSQGYPKVELYKGGVSKKKTVHRLVAEAFILNPHNLPWINHIDERRSNPRVDNLEWCSPSYNRQYSLDKRKSPDNTSLQRIEQGIEKLRTRFNLTKEELKNLL